MLLIYSLGIFQSTKYVIDCIIKIRLFTIGTVDTWIQ
ncbi:MAG: hypothetical protein K0S76_2394 [Herbinix sp.]|jgi:hypothetical protein|nr:hypothetical protein [Herbinix sp.]